MASAVAWAPCLEWRHLLPPKKCAFAMQSLPGARWLWGKGRGCKQPSKAPRNACKATVDPSTFNDGQQVHKDALLIWK